MVQTQLTTDKMYTKNFVVKRKSYIYLFDIRNNKSKPPSHKIHIYNAKN
jgi:hypothetical protein